MSSPRAELSPEASHYLSQGGQSRRTDAAVGDEYISLELLCAQVSDPVPNWVPVLSVLSVTTPHEGGSQPREVK